MKRWTRRSLLIGGALIALPLAGLGGGSLWCRVTGRQPMRTRAALLRDVYPASAAVRDLGWRYLAQTGSTAERSLRRLEGRAEIASAADSGCAKATMAALERACRDDFRRGRVHCIDGWVMAETELDMAALCAMRAAA
jgi:hypothetical protein